MWTQTSFIEPRRRLRDMPDEIQPLYRLSQVGPEALSSVELLALALGGREADGVEAEAARFVPYTLRGVHPDAP